MSLHNRHFDPDPPEIPEGGPYSEPGWPYYDGSENHPFESLMESEGRCIHCGLYSKSASHKRPWAKPAPMRPQTESWIS